MPLSYAGSESCPLPLAHTLLEWELNKEESENANQFHFFRDNFALGHYCSNLVPPRAKSVRELSAYQIFWVPFCRTLQSGKNSRDAQEYRAYKKVPPPLWNRARILNCELLKCFVHILTANIFESGPMPTPNKFFDGLSLLPSCKLG